MSPLEFMQRPAALVPRPRLHLIRFHGVLAPHAKLRAAIVPIPEQTTTGHAADCDHAHGARPGMSWARLLKRVFDLDVERCGQCGGKMKIIAAIEEPGACRTRVRQAPQAKPPLRTVRKCRQETVKPSLLRADAAKRLRNWTLFTLAPRGKDCFSSLACEKKSPDVRNRYSPSRYQRPTTALSGVTTELTANCRRAFRRPLEALVRR